MTGDTALRDFLRGLPRPVKQRLLRVKGRVDRIRWMGRVSNQSYWTAHNVTDHRRFASREESLEALNWRNDQYLFYESFLPLGRLGGLTLLDYGCGPGHDLVAMVEGSDASRIIGMDISSRSLAESRHRLTFHKAGHVELMAIDEGDARIPLDDASVDLIVSSGVLHHCPNIADILTEFRRILRPGGEILVMVYNESSIFVHLGVAYLRQIVQRIDAGLTLSDAFRRSTDGEGCPYSVMYTPAQMAAVASGAGLSSRYLGAAVSVDEMSMLSKRFDAIHDARLGAAHRAFLRSLTFDEYGRPLHDDQVAGIDAFYRLTPS